MKPSPSVGRSVADVNSRALHLAEQGVSAHTPDPWRYPPKLLQVVLLRARDCACRSDGYPVIQQATWSLTVGRGKGGTGGLAMVESTPDTRSVTITRPSVALAL